MDCTSIVEAYLRHLGASFKVIPSGDGCRLITPNLRPDGEAVEVVVSMLRNGRIRLTDEFTTVDYLFVNGLRIEENDKLGDKAALIATKHGVSLRDSELFIEVDSGQEEIALDKLLKSIEAITYLIYKRSHRDTRTFMGEVELYLAENDVVFQEWREVSGKTLPQSLPIFVNGSRNLSISPLSSKSVSKARHITNELGYIISDVKSANPSIRFAAVLDDRVGTWEDAWRNQRVNTILTSVMDHIIRWEERPKLLDLVR